MARSATTRLTVAPREGTGSRAVRRLRRSGRVPGVLYGGGGEPVPFDVDARELRLALAAAGAVLDVTVDGGEATPAVLKDAQHHPVRGETVHVDLQRVRLDRAIQAMVTIELVGADDAPGVKAGGVLEQITREVTVEALPTEIPEAIVHDVSEMDMNETLTLASIKAPGGVKLLDDPDETLIATLTPPRLQLEEEEEIEEETEVIGEGAPAEGEAETPDAPGGDDGE